MHVPDGVPKDVTIAVFGATGRTGHHVVRHALGGGHRVRALARDPGRMGVENDRLTIVQGDFETVEALRERPSAVPAMSSAAPEGPTARGMTRG
jgi:uncharacterized protein YbjT (DUF2867 family)